uniref:DUF5641 domain-containing protein n=1 Tax=Phlebotomus papatasi TaxID=29031 RepID=A0A1B0D078_PHLPP
MKPAAWKMGRVTATHPGKDLAVRVVTIRTFARVLTALFCSPSFGNWSMFSAWTYVLEYN